MLLAFESIGILSDCLTPTNYIQCGVLKILSFALNVGIPFSFSYINKDMALPYFNFVKVFQDLSTEEKKNEYLKQITMVMEYYNNSNACFIYPDFQEIDKAITDVNDLMDCLECYKPISPYNPSKVTSKLPDEFLKLDKKDEELKYLDPEDKDERERTFVKPLIQKNKNLADENAKELLKKQLYPLEKLVVMQFEKMNFYLDLAANEWSGEENIKKLLTKKIMPLGNRSIAIYGSISKLISLRTDVIRYQSTGDSKTEYDSKDITPLLNAVSASIPIKVKVIEDIIVLMHGILEESRFNSITAQYNAQNPNLKLKTNLIKLLFISSYIRHRKLNAVTFTELIMLLIYRLYPRKPNQSEAAYNSIVDDKKKIIFSLIDIFKAKYEDKVKMGIMNLVKLGAPKRKNGESILENLLSIITWKNPEDKTM